MSTEYNRFDYMNDCRATVKPEFAMYDISQYDVPCGDDEHLGCVHCGSCQCEQVIGRDINMCIDGPLCRECFAEKVA